MSEHLHAGKTLLSSVAAGLGSLLQFAAPQEPLHYDSDAEMQKRAWNSVGSAFSRAFHEIDKRDERADS